MSSGHTSRVSPQATSVQVQPAGDRDAKEIMKAQLEAGKKAHDEAKAQVDRDKEKEALKRNTSASANGKKAELSAPPPLINTAATGRKIEAAAAKKADATPAKDPPPKKGPEPKEKDFGPVVPITGPKSSGSESAFGAYIPPVDTADDKKQDSVQVAIRMRPMNKREKELKDTVCVQLFPPKSMQITLPPPEGEKKFTFDAVFTDDLGQEHVYNTIVRKLVDGAIKGFNACLFAYGQTGSGKTFTMYGPGMKPDNKNDMGLVYRAADQLMSHIKSTESTMIWQMKTEYMEIYNEVLQDLMTDKEEELKIREDPINGIYVAGITQKVVNTFNDFTSVIVEGSARSTVGFTKMNAESSRSHKVFSVKIVQQQVDDKSGVSKIESALHMIDLAGSERLGKTEATGQAMKEGAAINGSLMALGNVIQSLVDKTKHIPYRDSKLTRLLQNSLGGNSLTCMVANCSPASNNAQETLSTLRFADRAKRIKNKAVINMDPKVARIKELEKIVISLKQRLSKYETVNEDGTTTATADSKDVNLEIKKDDGIPCCVVFGAACSVM